MRLRRRWVGNETPHVNQQGVRERVQVEPEEIGEITVVAQPICLETALQFFVPILAFTAIRILLIGAAGITFAPGRLLTTARRLVPCALTSHFTVTQRSRVQVAARYQKAQNNRWS